MRPLRLVAVIGIAASLPLIGQGVSAQTLTYSLFERYLDSLVESAVIPGVSALILQNGTVAWERYYGKADVDQSLDTRPDTPYVIGELSQTVGATLLLKKCVDESYLELNDLVTRWVPTYGEPSTTVRQLLSHAAPGGGYTYSPSRFAQLTPVIVECAHSAYPKLVWGELLDRFNMANSSPGSTFSSPTSDDRQDFTADQIAGFANVLRRAAVPYRVDRSGRPNRSDVAPRALDMSSGLVMTGRDLARFDAALGDPIGGSLLIDPSTMQLSWPDPSSSRGMGFGWFVQTYNGEKLVWQFGLTPNAYSSIILKVPGRRLTLIMLANSDGLAAPFGLENGDVTTSIFARTFLKLFIS